QGAILAYPNSFVVLNALTGPHPSNQLGHLVIATKWHQHSDRLSAHVHFGIAVKALSAPIPEHHAPLEVRADDRVARRFDDRDEMRRGSLDAFTLGDIADRARDERA